jgi:hypothetical protein
MKKATNRNVEKTLLILLFCITVFQFSGWGYQSVIYVLSQMFDVATSSTPIDMIIGLIAMIASALVFAGAAMWWRSNPNALTYITIGSLIFVVKNIFDAINDVWVFSITHTAVQLADVEGLAAQVGGQFFQLAFWVFVFFYIKYTIENAPSEEEREAFAAQQVATQETHWTAQPAPAQAGEPRNS